MQRERNSGVLEEKFRSMENLSRRIINNFDDPIKLICNYIDKDSEADMVCTLEAQPCLLRYCDQEMIDKYVRKEVSEREGLIEIIHTRAKQLQANRNFICIFKESGLYDFVTNGRIIKFPKEIVDRICIAD